jgi:hypothetical protein
MDANHASTESYVDCHHRAVQALRDGTIADPERWLFLLLLGDLPETLIATPWLYDASWCSGQFDLLFTDGHGEWCAVEVKDAPEIYDTGRARKNRRTKHRQRRGTLASQTERAAKQAAAWFPSDVVRAIGLWRTDGQWTLLYEVAAHDRALAA